MYEKLTGYIPFLELDGHGKGLADTEKAGTSEHPIRMSDVDSVDPFEELVLEKLSKTIYEFYESHPEFGLRHYHNILKKHGIEWSMDSMTAADVSRFGGKTVVALLFAAIRAERWSPGTLLEFSKNGCILKWLHRLQKIDAK